jgi:hypothetical protein
LRRMPVFAASHKAGNSRSDLAVSKKVSSCVEVQARTSLGDRRRFGGSASAGSRSCGMLAQRRQ